MAQVVGYFENFISEEREKEAYSEGPFVIVNAWGWRIECEVKGAKCPAFPDVSIYKLRDQAGFKIGKFEVRAEAEALCDFLNQKVKAGVIVLGENGIWTAPDYKE